MISKYIIAGLIAGMLLLGWMYRSANSELAQTKTELAIAAEVAEQNRRTAERLESTLNNTNTILAAWDKDRTTLASVRNSVKKDIKEAMRNENFKAWAGGDVPADAWRLLKQANGADSNNTAGTASSAPSGVPGNGNPGVGR